MAKFELKFNDCDNWEEHDWLVLRDDQVVQGFATSNGAERWINDRDARSGSKAHSSPAPRLAAPPGATAT